MTEEGEKPDFEQAANIKFFFSFMSEIGVGYTSLGISRSLKSTFPTKLPGKTFFF